AAEFEVIAPACRLENGDHALALDFGLAVAVLNLVDACKIIEGRGQVRMLAAKPRLADGQAAQGQRLELDEGTLLTKKLDQVIERLLPIGLKFGEPRLVHVEQPLDHGNGLGSITGVEKLFDGDGGRDRIGRLVPGGVVTDFKAALEKRYRLGSPT